MIREHVQENTNREQDPSGPVEYGKFSRLIKGSPCSLVILHPAYCHRCSISSTLDTAILATILSCWCMRHKVCTLENRREPEMHHLGVFSDAWRVEL